MTAEYLFDEYAEIYQNKYWDVSKYSKSIDALCSEIKKDCPTLIELGCGPGNLTNALLAQLPTSNYLATDISSEMVKLSVKNNPTADHEVLDINNLATRSKTYDGIVAGFCIPYLSPEQVVDFLEAAKRMLNHGGMLYLSAIIATQNSKERTVSSDGQQHLDMYYYSKSWLINQLKNHGFTLLFDETIHIDNNPKNEKMDWTAVMRLDYNKKSPCPS